MIVADHLHGSADEARYAGRRVECLTVTWAEAGRRKLRRVTDDGTDVAVDLPPDSYLSDRAVLADDGDRIVVVRRPAERAVRVRFDRGLPHAALVACVARVAHVFGNQHVPVEVVEGELRSPVTTSDEVALATVSNLDLDGARASIEDLPLGRTRQLSAGHSRG